MTKVERLDNLRIFEMSQENYIVSNADIMKFDMIKNYIKDIMKYTWEIWSTSIYLL